MSDTGEEKSNEEARPTGSEIENSGSQKSSSQVPGAGANDAGATATASAVPSSGVTDGAGAGGGGGGGGGGGVADAPPSSASAPPSSVVSAVESKKRLSQTPVQLPEDSPTPADDDPELDAEQRPDLEPSPPPPPPSPSQQAVEQRKSMTKSALSTRARAYRRQRGVKVDLTNVRIGFLGSGKITEAIVRGLIGYTRIDPQRIFVASKSGRTHATFQEKGCIVTKRNYDIFAKLDCDVVFFTFHGFVVRNLYKTGGTRPMALTTNYIPNQRHLLYMLSLVGGISLNDIKHTLLNPENPDKYKLEMHRVMLNTSVAYGIGLGAIDIEPDSKKCSALVRDILTSFARIEFIPESSIDVACAVGGNGLAFCYYFLSAVADGGFKMGLPKQIAVKLAAKTLSSASNSLLESGKHPSDLRDQCTSPSGPAIYGLHVLDKADCASGIAAAVEGAFKRLKELVEVPHN